jgi:antitoxin (DNA-binding transcriptional repressor) of toxin-antitoxin stability system
MLFFAPETKPKDTIPLAEAKEYLEDLIARAARGEEVHIADPVHGTARIVVEAATATDLPLAPRVPGRWKDRLPPVPDDFFDPMSEEELKDWYGADT